MYSYTHEHEVWAPVQCLQMSMDLRVMQIKFLPFLQRAHWCDEAPSWLSTWHNEEIAWEGVSGTDCLGWPVEQPGNEILIMDHLRLTCRITWEGGLSDGLSRSTCGHVCGGCPDYVRWCGGQHHLLDWTHDINRREWVASWRWWFSLCSWLSIWSSAPSSCLGLPSVMDSDPGLQAA